MVPLELLQERAQTQAYGIEDLPWQPPSPTLPWFPSSQLPLAYTRGWSLLSPEEQLQANQWYALSVCEQFIFLEESFLVPAVKSLLHSRRRTLTPLLRDALETFVVEEDKHGAMFRRVLQSAAPHWYGAGDYHFYTPGNVGVAFGSLCLRRPEVFVAWPWLGMILEEKTIAYHRAYQSAAQAGEALCPLHRAVHHFHFLDEARHVQLEAHLIALLYDAAKPFVQAANRHLLYRTLRQYTRPRARSVSCNVVRALVRKFPRLAVQEETLLQGVIDLRHNRRFQRDIYGERAIPQTFRLLDAHPELRGIAAVSPSYGDRLARAAEQAASTAA